MRGQVNEQLMMEGESRGSEERMMDKIDDGGRGKGKGRRKAA